MSGAVALTIVTNEDWAVQMSWLDSVGNPIPYSSPSMHIRQELSPTGRLIARLDDSGFLDGFIAFPAEGTMLLTMSADTTKTLQTGNGFWDLFVRVNNRRIRFAFGTISIVPHVTELS